MKSDLNNFSLGAAFQNSLFARTQELNRSPKGINGRRATSAKVVRKLWNSLGPANRNAGAMINFSGFNFRVTLVMFVGSTTIKSPASPNREIPGKSEK
jgi:hypothetical protein